MDGGVQQKQSNQYVNKMAPIWWLDYVLKIFFRSFSKLFKKSFDMSFVSFRADDDDVVDDDGEAIMFCSGGA